MIEVSVRLEGKTQEEVRRAAQVMNVVVTTVKGRPNCWQLYGYRRIDTES